MAVGDRPHANVKYSNEQSVSLECHLACPFQQNVPSQSWRASFELDILYNIIFGHDGLNGFESHIYTFIVSVIKIMMLIITHFLLLLIFFPVVPQMTIQDGLAKTESHTHPALVGW